jgi:hypothetical protein
MHPIKWLKLKSWGCKKSKISGRNAKCFRKKAWIQNWYPTTPQSSIFIDRRWRDWGRFTSRTNRGRLENFIGFKFWGYSFVFLISCLFCFCFAALFCFDFLLRLKIFVYFPLCFCCSCLMLICLHMLLSWVHLILPSFFQV